MKRLVLFLALLASPLLIVAPAAVMAADKQPVGIFDDGACAKAKANGGSEPAFCKDKNLPKDSDGKTENPLYGPKSILVTLINILSIIAGIAAVIIIILAGFRYITSGTNPQEVTNARERIIYALIGLAVASLAQFIVRFVIGKTGII